MFSEAQCSIGILRFSILHIHRIFWYTIRTHTVSMKFSAEIIQDTYNKTARLRIDAFKYTRHTESEVVHKRGKCMMENAEVLRVIPLFKFSVKEVSNVCTVEYFRVYSFLAANG